MADDPQYPVPYVELEFADGAYLFKLGLQQIAELQTKCGGDGIGKIFGRISKGRYSRVDGGNIGLPEEGEWKVHDVLETIRLGLIGGNQGTVDGATIKVDPMTASRLVRDYAYPARPLAESWTLAYAILGAVIVGYSPATEKKSPETGGSISPSP